MDSSSKTRGGRGLTHSKWILNGNADDEFFCSKVISKVTDSKTMSKVTQAQKKVEKVTKHVPPVFMQMAANAVEGASGAHDKVRSHFPLQKLGIY